MARFQESGQSSEVFFREEERRELALQAERKRLAWIQSLRESNSPYGQKTHPVFRYLKISSFSMRINL